MVQKQYKKVTSCGALTWRYDINNDFEVLLIKQFAHKDRWGIPKGHIHENETLEQCAIREVREEAGVNVDLREKLSPVFTVYGDESKTVHAWLAVANGNDVPETSDPDCEVADAKWFKVSELPQIHAYQQSLLNEGLAILQMSYGLYHSNDE